MGGGGKRSYHIQNGLDEGTALPHPFREILQFSSSRKLLIEKQIANFLIV
jgi:hypothetical protein